VTDGGVLLTSEPAEGVVQVTLNRPDRLNALTPDLLGRFDAVLDDVARDPAVRVVILTGAGRGFCAGFDLDELAGTWSQGLPELLANQEGWAATVRRMVELPVPVIAAVNGPAIGAGMSLALGADLRVVSTRAKFAAAFVRVGLSGADLGLSWTLPRVTGLGVAAELMLTGRQVDAAESQGMGIANRVCEPDELLPAALELAAQIAANSPFGVKLTKRVLHAGVDAPSFAAAIDTENRNQILASRTEDMAEALKARQEGRTPAFGNR
jgi:enoyl-CoA hydratase